jgi:DNA-binding PadR family transcriptional regulator
MKKRKVSNPLGLAILSLLFEKQMHPYEMASTLRERHKEASIKLNYGSLYTVIAALEREGFICAGEKTREGARPERTIYTLTETGEVELHDWLRELLRVPVKEFSQFEAGLSLMPILPPEEVSDLLSKRHQLLEKEISKLRSDFQMALDQGVDRLFLIEMEFLLAMREAEQAWVEKLSTLIGKSSGFTKTWREWHRLRSKNHAGNQKNKGV